MRRTIPVLTCCLAVLVTAACSNAVVPTASPAPTQPPPPTTEPEPGPTWPLTGLPVADEAETEVPALVTKIDNSAPARPHAALNQADLVYEVWVEGITRFAAVFHSEIVDHVGPIRSARSTDVDLVANLNKPILVWSGGNPGVLGEIGAAVDDGLLINASHDVAPGDYWREPGRSGPHNLFADAAAIRDQFAEPDAPGPDPLFRYRDESDPPLGLPAAGVSIDFGEGSIAQYLWDEERQCALRFQAGEVFEDESGEQVCAENVVVMFTEYGESLADARSPQAYTVGSGNGLAFTGGHLVALSWERPGRPVHASLRDGEDRPVELAPGRTWVAMPRLESPWALIEESEAAELAERAAQHSAGGEGEGPDAEPPGDD